MAKNTQNTLALASFWPHEMWGRAGRALWNGGKSTTPCSKLKFNFTPKMRERWNVMLSNVYKKLKMNVFRNNFIVPFIWLVCLFASNCNRGSKSFCALKTSQITLPITVNHCCQICSNQLPRYPRKQEPINKHVLLTVILVDKKCFETS